MVAQPDSSQGNQAAEPVMLTVAAPIVLPAALAPTLDLQAMGFRAKLHQKLIAAIKASGGVAKDSTNAFHKYKYASVEAVLEMARDALADAGVWITMNPVSFDLTGTLRSSTGKERSVYESWWDFVICDSETGYTETIRWRSDAIDDEDKAVGKLVAAALKYFLRSLLMLPWSDGEAPPAAVEPDAEGYVDRGGAQRRTTAARAGASPSVVRGSEIPQGQKVEDKYAFDLPNWNVDGHLDKAAYTSFNRVAAGLSLIGKTFDNAADRSAQMINGVKSEIKAAVDTLGKGPLDRGACTSWLKSRYEEVSSTWDKEAMMILARIIEPQGDPEELLTAIFLQGKVAEQDVLNHLAELAEPKGGTVHPVQAGAS